MPYISSFTLVPCSHMTRWVCVVYPRWFPEVTWPDGLCCISIMVPCSHLTRWVVLYNYGSLQSCDRWVSVVYPWWFPAPFCLTFEPSLSFLQSPPKGATIPYRPKPAVPPVVYAGGQAFIIQNPQMPMPPPTEVSTEAFVT